MVCGTCGGRGSIPHKICRGTGRLKGGTLGEWDRGECPGCHGTGVVVCPACGGKG